jgi:hypothetical protein
MAAEVDEVSERLAALAEDLARELGDDATVTVEPVGPNEVTTTITPKSAEALSVEWTDSGDILDLTAGHNGGSWDFLETGDVQGVGTPRTVAQPTEPVDLVSRARGDRTGWELGAQEKSSAVCGIDIRHRAILPANAATLSQRRSRMFSCCVSAPPRGGVWSVVDVLGTLNVRMGHRACEPARASPDHRMGRPWRLTKRQELHGMPSIWP